MVASCLDSSGCAQRAAASAQHDRQALSGRRPEASEPRSAREQQRHRGPLLRTAEQEDAGARRGVLQALSK